MPIQPTIPVNIRVATPGVQTEVLDEKEALEGLDEAAEFASQNEISDASKFDSETGTATSMPSVEVPGVQITPLGSFPSVPVTDQKLQLSEQDIALFVGFQRHSAGKTVQKLQQALNFLGAELTVDGDYGRRTVEAVEGFQSENDLEVTGKINQRTANLIFDQLSEVPEASGFTLSDIDRGADFIGLHSGMKNARVEKLQLRLKELGFFNHAVDGDFGKKTRVAVKGFQMRAGLASDGEIGELTALKLMSDRHIDKLYDLPSENAPTSISLERFLKLPNLMLSDQEAEKMLPYLNMTMRILGIKSAVETSIFLSQMAHETLYFSKLKEASSRHASSKSTYKGRGFVHLTGKWNYDAAGKFLKLPLKSHPSLVEKYEYAAMTTAWFWKYRNISSPAKRGDIRGVINKINRGDPSTSRRIKYYRNVKRRLYA